MNERMRDVSLIRRNSYKNFVLDLYKSNNCLINESLDNVVMTHIIATNLCNTDAHFINITLPESIDLMHSDSDINTERIIQQIKQYHEAMKDTICIPINLFDDDVCQRLFPIKSIDKIYTYGEVYNIPINDNSTQKDSKETFNIKIIRDNDMEQEVDFLMSNNLPVGTRYDVSMIFITENQPFIRLIKYLNGYRNKNFNYMEKSYIALITDSESSEELLEKLNKIMDFMDDEKMNVNKFIKEEFGIKKKKVIPELGLEENQEVENLNVEPRETIILPESDIKVIVGEELKKSIEKEDSKLSIPDILNVEDTYKNPESYGLLINRLLKEFYSIDESEKTTITREKLLGLITTLHDLADRHKDYKPVEEKENDESNSSDGIVNEINEFEEDIVEDGLVTHLVPEDDDKMVDTLDKNDFSDISMFSPETLTYEKKFKKLLSYTNIIISYDLERRILESFNSTKPLIISNSNKDVYYLLMFLFMTNSFAISSISNETPDDIVKKFMNIFNGYRNILSEKIKTEYGIVRYFMKANKITQGISNDIECESPFEYTDFNINTFINLTNMTKKEIKKVMESMMSRNEYTFYVILTDDISKIKTDNVILDSYFDKPKTRLNKLLKIFKN